MTVNPIINTLGVNKAKWSANQKNVKLLLHDKTHAIIAFPGQDFVNLGGLRRDFYEPTITQHYSTKISSED